MQHGRQEFWEHDTDPVGYKNHRVMHGYRRSTNVSAPGEKGKRGGGDYDEECSGQEWDILLDADPVVRRNMRLNTPARRC